MGIRYIIGRSGTGKSSLVLDEIGASLKKGNHRKLILIVPQQFTLQAERDLIEKLNLSGIIDVEVLSFTRLAHTVLNEAGGITRIHINNQGKNMILRKIIDEGKDNLTIYKTASTQDGFIELISELLSEMKQHNLTPDNLIEKLATGSQQSIINSKLKDISYIYQQFNRYLQGRYIDSEDYINLLIEKIELSTFLQGAKIWIDGFHTFTPQTYQIIEKLCLMAEEVTVTLTAEIAKQANDSDLFKLSNETYQSLHNIAGKYSMVEEITDLNQKQENSIKKSAEICHLEQELYAYPYKVYEEDVKKIEIFSGLNIYTEVENTAVQIVSLVRDKGFRYQDIAVVGNNLETYGPVIKKIFGEYQIPFFLDQKRSIMHNPIIELILSLLAIIDRGYRFNDVFKYIKTGFAGLEIDDFELLENYALQYGIQGSKWQEEFTAGNENLLKRLNRSRKKFIEPVTDLEKKIKGRKTVEEITRYLYGFLTQQKLQEQLETIIDTLREKGHYEYVYEYTQIWNIIMNTFDQLVEILAEQEVTIGEYQRILESGFMSLQIGIIPTTIDQVLVGNIHRSKSHDIKALFVVGVNDGILPVGKDFDGILSDEERIFLKDNGLPLEYNSQRKTAEEKLMIYSALSKPTDYLLVSYAMADQEGKTMRPSLLIDRLKKIFNKIEVKSDVINDSAKQQQMISIPNSTLKHLTANLRGYLDGLTMDPVWITVYNWYQNQQQWEPVKNKITKGLFHKNQADYIGRDYAKELYQTPVKSSVSRLEQFVNCPFAHFIKYGLRPQERKEYGVKSLDIGDIFHKSLELFTVKLKENKLNWREISREQCNLIIDGVVDELIPTYGNGVMLSSNRYKYLVNRLKRISRRAVWVLTEQIKRSSFEPLGSEIAFGIDKEYPPIEVELAGGEKIYLEGRIDRVDIFEGEESSYVKITDYKSGYKEFNLSDVYHGLQLQLMVYLNAILKNKDKLNRKQLKPAGVFYFKIDDPFVKKHDINQETLEKELRKELKMKGIALKDIQIIREIDNQIDGHSEIIPVGITKNNSFHKYSSVIEYQDFETLLNYVESLVKQISEEMLKGNIRIEPVKKDKLTACSYCDYQSICQFDQAFEDNTYKNIKKLKNSEFIPKVGEILGVSKNGD